MNFQNNPIGTDTQDTEKITKASWRDVLKIHPAAELFPLMSEPELRELGEDIKTRGGLVQAVHLHQGKLLDGRNRLDAMELVGFTFDDTNVRRLAHNLPDSVDPYDYVISANLHRRHLTSEQKRELIAKVLKAKPNTSNRKIAKQVKADDKTVASVRRDLESTAEIPQLEKTVGADGKERKSRAKKIEMDVERDRKACIALDLKVKEANRELAQWHLDHPVTASAEISVEQRRAENALLDHDNIEPKLTAEERWHNSLSIMAGEAISLEAYWTKEFGQWENFDVGSDLVTLAAQAAESWKDLAAKLKAKNPNAKRSAGGRRL